MLVKPKRYGKSSLDFKHGFGYRFRIEAGRDLSGKPEPVHCRTGQVKDCRRKRGETRPRAAGEIGPVNSCRGRALPAERDTALGRCCGVDKTVFRCRYPICRRLNRPVVGRKPLSVPIRTRSVGHVPLSHRRNIFPGFIICIPIILVQLTMSRNFIPKILNVCVRTSTGIKNKRHCAHGSPTPWVGWQISPQCFNTTVDE